MMGQFAMSLALLTLSGWLIDRHRREWRDAQADDQTDARMWQFTKSKHRRRMLASSTIGIVGALIAVEPLVPRTPTWMSIYLVLLLCCFLTILVCGIVDAWAGARLYREARLEQRVKQARMAWELRKSSSRDATEEPTDEP